MSKDKKTKKDFLLDEELNSSELASKGSKRALQIRRALEDREESKRLNAFIGDDYWEDI